MATKSFLNMMNALDTVECKSPCERQIRSSLQTQLRDKIRYHGRDTEYLPGKGFRLKPLR